MLGLVFWFAFWFDFYRYSHGSSDVIIWFFLVFFIEEYISLEEGFLIVSFLKSSIFEPLCFLKWRSIFNGPFEHLWKSNQKTIFILLIFLLKSTPYWLTSTQLHHWGHTNRLDDSNQYLLGRHECALSMKK